VDLADIHGQYKFNFNQRAISRDDSKKFLDYAFVRDFERNGPSLYRICRTAFEGWKRYSGHADARIRARFERDASTLKLLYTGALWAIESRLRRTNAAVSERVRMLRKEIERALGPVSALSGNLVGPLMYLTVWREERRLARGQTYEPPTVVERTNWALDEAV
jgi:hypothetical protein